MNPGCSYENELAVSLYNWFSNTGTVITGDSHGSISVIVNFVTVDTSVALSGVPVMLT